MKKLALSADPSIYHGGVWPTAPQQLLLQAALLDAPAAINAWEAWLETAPLDALDAGSWRLIPLVYVNLKRLGVRHPLLVQARECHLYHWRCNQKLFHLSAGFLGELHRRNIPTLVLKGVALANLYYPDTGARAMADLDLLVPVGDFMALAKSLLRQGWEETDGHSFASLRMGTLPSFGFKRPDGFWVHLHYHVLHENCAKGADDAFWARAQPWALRHIPTLTLAPEDQLLHVISHGIRWCDVPPFRWIADAWWILARTRGSFDWERFLDQARFHQVNLALFRGLELMNQITPLDLPANLLSRLEAIPVSARARVHFICWTHQVPGSFFARVRQIWRVMGESGPGYTIAGKSVNPRTHKAPRRNLLTLGSLLPFFLKVAVRDRKRILTELLAWLRQTPRAPSAPSTL